ncbi:hypothetical protein AOL_s00176g30 [Orbilia oligospora ATCC 24927]|uniref:Uncharacterized protein n=1 Tax=Arthrobotrys oligospora (strain ATCC 24927 / CBS 115.81 / DSM 1491) TaxID=756982 RepID=G1XPQ6_ARTOA|nr:hypothetical protein AOL_s00176g30 [Orbilia oligospora ATCC 24927]EGX44859.1 hypothetical protein AOL_s00176g30 [Orbilia oligospora ATCC 24927]
MQYSKSLKMLSHSALLFLTIFLYSTPSTALSYSMISTKDKIDDPKGRTPKTYVQTRPVGCTSMTESPIIRTDADANTRPADQGSWAGISIHQDQWSQESKWMGFWARRECNRNLPSLIIHWYPDAPTDQIFDIRRLKEYLPRLTEGDYRYMSWGEMSVVPQAIQDNLAPGSIAIREKKPSRVLGSEDQAWYGVFEDVVMITTNPYDEMENDLSGFSARGAGRKGKQLHLTFRNEQFTRAKDGPGGEDYPIPEDQLQDQNVEEIPQEEQIQNMEFEQIQPEGQIQNGGQIQQEEEQIPMSEAQVPVSRQQSGGIINSPVPIQRGESSASSERQSSLGGFPEATVLLRLGAESPPSANQEEIGVTNTQIAIENIPANFQQGNMEEELPPNAQNPEPQAQFSPGVGEITSAVNQLQVQLQNAMSNLGAPDSLNVDAVLNNLGTNADSIAQSIRILGPESALTSVLNRISAQRLHSEMSLLTPVQTMELAGHQMSNWGPFALANALGELRIRREIRSGLLTPAEADEIKARADVVSNTELELAAKVIREVGGRARSTQNQAPNQVLNQAQNSARVQLGPELLTEGTPSNNDLLENIPPINSLNSFAELSGPGNQDLLQNGRLPGGNIEFEEPVVPAQLEQSILPAAPVQGSIQGQGTQVEAPATNPLVQSLVQSQAQEFDDTEDDEAWKTIVVHGPIEEEDDTIRTLNRGAVISNMLNRVDELQRRHRNPRDSYSASESEAAPIASSESQSDLASESSSYVPKGWEVESSSSGIEEGESSPTQEDLSEEQFIASDDGFIATEEDSSEEGDYTPSASSPEERNDSPVRLRRGRSRGRPRT